jgi:hypothetical protein
MAIKRKTHLNLSGSHHTLDSDNGFVGGTFYITGVLSASAGITGSIQYVDTISTPFIIAGPYITASYNSLGQWEITGSAPVASTNFWTEFDGSTIYTTSSVRVANLSASLGANITGSLRLTGSFSQGAFTTVAGVEAHAHGYNVSATGDYSHAEGVNTTAAGNYSHAEGTGNTASAASSHAEGDNTLAEGEASHTEGQFSRTTSGGQWAHAEGYMTTGSAQYSHAEGRETTASGQYSHAEGGTTVASAIAAHSEGLFSTASNDGAHSEGYSTTAGGYASHTEGSSTIAFGQYAHAEGYSTTAGGYASHAEGSGTITYSAYSHAEGTGSITSGEYSHAMGYQTATIGTGSLAAGLGTNSYGSIDGIDPPNIVQAAFGKYNTINNYDSLFVVGDGFTNSSRHDVLRVNSGSVQVTGSFEVTGAIKFDTINVSPLFATMTTGDATGTVLSGSLLTSNLANASVGKLDFNVLAASGISDDYASFTFSATIRKNQAGSTLVIAATELDSIYDGTSAAGWDVNINGNGDIICTGSAGNVYWYAQVTKKMILSGSGTVLY